MDVTKLADEVFDILSGYIARLIAPIHARLQAVEARPSPEKGENGDKGEDGKSVTIEEVQPILERAVDRWALDFERRAQDLLQRAIERMPTPKDGDKGEDGIDGIGFDDMLVEHDGKREVTLKFQKGDIVKSFVITIPSVIDAGFWKSGTTFETGDGVTDGGSYWIAQKETSSRPEVGNPDWRLAVRKGRDARMETHVARDPKPVKLGGTS